MQNQTEHRIKEKEYVEFIFISDSTIFSLGFIFGVNYLIMAFLKGIELSMELVTICLLMLGGMIMFVKVVR